MIREKWRRRRIEGSNWYRVYWAKSLTWNCQNAIDFRWSDAKEKEDIALANLIKSLQKQTDEEFTKK